MDFNRLFPLSSLYFEPLSGRAVDSHVEHRRLGFVALARRHASHLVGLRSSSTVGNYLTALRSFSSFLVVRMCRWGPLRPVWCVAMHDGWPTGA